MKLKYGIIFIIASFTNLSFGQHLGICYEPIKQGIKNGEWNNIDAHLDTIHANCSRGWLMSDEPRLSDPIEINI